MRRETPRFRNNSGAPGWRGGSVRAAEDLFFLPEDGNDAGGLRPIARQTRAYFAPVDRVIWADGGFRSFAKQRVFAGCSLGSLD